MDLNKILYFSLLRFCGEQQEEKEELLKITNYQNEEGDFLLATLPKKREITYNEAGERYRLERDANGGNVPDVLLKELYTNYTKSQKSK